jgi:subtilisin family serine protease
VAVISPNQIFNRIPFMKKSTLLALAGLLLVANGCQKQGSLLLPQSSSAPDPAALDRFIQEKLEDEGQFLWQWASDEQVWTALSNSDNVLSVGYQPAGESDVADRLHLIDIQSDAWKSARQEAMRIVLEHERQLNPSLTESALLAFPDNPVLPVFDVVVRNPATVAALRRSPVIRYAEPIGYEPYMTERAGDRSGSGCDSNYGEPGLIAGTDYTNITPNCKQSWNYSYHNISQAWNSSTGAGCKVVIIDTGCSDAQENLGSAFNQGSSTGRTIDKFVTLPANGSPETPNDGCGHGTSMQGACAAPRGTDGNAVGIAYRCNLVSIRAAADVYLDESRETVGVTNAFTQAGNITSVKIISISMGRLTSSSQISDAVKYAYNKGKLIFAAAGTSYWWTAWFAGVIFPANMAECSAITGVKSNLTTRCGDCHSGSKVDFVLVMEHATSGVFPLSLADYGDVPSTVGGSSVATASTAGIAALVWAKYPSWTRTQVFNRLKTSANYYPTRNSNFGWGRINAQLATQ